MYFNYLNGLRRATTYMLRRARRQGTRTGEMPPAVQWRRGRYGSGGQLSPFLRIVVWCIPALMLLGGALMVDQTPGVKSTWMGILLAAAAIVMGLGAVLGEPKRTSSYWIFSVNFAAIAFYFVMLRGA